MKLLVASRNAKKLAELRRVLAGANLHPIEVMGLDDIPAFPEAPEDGATFSDNALIKARDGARRSGWVTIADDSGLTIEALNGMPGVLSARWCGEHGRDEDNVQLVLGQLHDVPEDRRGAAFVCAVALVVPRAYASPGELSANGLQPEVVVEGTWQGSIATAPRGGHGFGYDPIFLPYDVPGRTSAQLSAEEKDSRSHRGHALRSALPILAALADIGQ